MGKAARAKAQRRAAVAPPPVGKQRAQVSQRTILLATGGVAVAVVAVVAALLLTRSTTKAPPPAAPSAADRSAPASLVKAANAVGFHPNVEPGVGAVESQPASAAPQSQSPSLLPVGSTAPGFTLKTPTGQRVSLSGYRGKAVLLEFFATWCPHCAAEGPHLRQILASLPASRYAFVSVNADGETAPSVYAYHRYFGFTFPALLDPSSVAGSFSHPGYPGPVTRRYGVQAFPTFYVLDPHGKIVWRSDGEQPDVLVRQELAKAAGA